MGIWDDGGSESEYLQTILSDRMTPNGSKNFYKQPVVNGIMKIVRFSSRRIRGSCQRD
jgi:hypothetical protein